MRSRNLQDKLMKIKEKYNKNFEVILSCRKESKQHLEAVALENRLNKEEIGLQKQLGVFVPDPCPCNVSICCSQCSGFYHKEVKMFRGVEKYKNVRYRKDIPEDAIKCPFKGKATEDNLKKFL